MNKTCGTCKYWGNSESKTQFRACQKIIHDADYNAGNSRLSDEAYEEDLDSRRPDQREEEKAFRAEHNAVVMDGSGYHAALKCRQDFGCVNHQEIDFGVLGSSSPPN